MCQLGVIRLNKPSQLLRSRWKNTFFCGPNPGFFYFFIPCLSQMTSEISHGSLLTARYRTRLLIALFKVPNTGALNLTVRPLQSCKTNPSSDARRYLGDATVFERDVLRKI